MEKIAKNRKKYSCLTCDYNTFNKFDYEKHLETEKHKIAILAIQSNDLSQKSQKIAYSCNCGKVYQDNSGLWRHKKKCAFQESSSNKTIDSEQLKVFSDIVKTTVVEVMKNGVSNTNHSHNQTQKHNHSHNKTFNLNFYLNETCKDAMDIDEFVKTAVVDIDALENTGRVGYVEGITNIITRNLNAMKIHKRPLHCTDEKREVLYIKKNGEWIKETEDKPILTNAVKIIANENIKNISKWKNIYPDCTSSNSKKNDLYLKIVSNSMSGATKDECEKNYNKIIRNIVKETVIDKDIEK